ncbi:dermonecrotic toxin domain-containing protein [Pseudomonas lactucae]|uniref:dermonecrotic toxin domain-containing protein n=1 Tax=Pseudomonas lactucae TaxID=2813360 RepID=UPI002FCD1E63
MLTTTPTRNFSSTSTPPKPAINDTSPAETTTTYRHPVSRQKSPKRRNHHQTLIPGLPHNPAVDKFIAASTQGFKTPTQSTSDIIRAELKKRWGKDIDPDNTFITTLNYDPKKPKPADGKVLNKISLTQAALHNVQRANKTDEHQTAAEKNRSTLHTWLNRFAPLAPLPALIDSIDMQVHAKKTYEGIFTGTDPDMPQLYNQRTLLPETPAQFRDIVWNTDRSKPYVDFLNTFWPAHEQKYAQTSKASFIGAALAQFNNDSLNEHNTNLVMRAAGVPLDTTWSSLTLDDLKSSRVKDPSVEVGLLKINGFQSTDLLYITDKKSRTAADGKTINPTLLYIPGNSSPIHSFDSPAQMKNWLAEQAADPVKREALSMHFQLRDQANRYFSDGVNQTLTGLGGWSRKDADDAGPLERLNEFDPQTFITTEPLSDDPFKVMTQRQKARSYVDAETEITTDGDVTKATILEVLETTTKIALLMTPLALVMPEVAVALEVFYVAAGAAEVGIGADDLKHGKPGGADHIVFGVLNALPVVAGGATRALNGVETGEAAAGEYLETSELAEENTTPVAPEPAKPVGEPIANRLQPSRTADISAYAVPDGETVLERATRNAKGIHQLKDSAQIDHWYIQYKDATGVLNVYEIKSDFKLSHDYVQIIDPVTRKPVMTVHAGADGEWVRGIGPGGARTWPWQRKPSPTPSNELKTPGKFSDTFLELDGSKIQAAEKFNDYLLMDDRIRYESSSAFFEENGVVKRKLGVSWTLEDKPFAVAPAETARTTPLANGEYSDSFTKDIHRLRYTVVTKENGRVTQTELSSSATTEEGLKRDRLQQLETLIPDPVLRARISEVAHQGSLAEGTTHMNQPDSGLRDGYYLTGGDTQITIEYDKVTQQAQVHFTSKNPIANPDQDVQRVPGALITTKRTFTISPSNDINSDGEQVYVIDKQAPTQIELSVVVDQEPATQ